jgi:quercetin dioxygenase-like cupin family protein
MQYTYPHTIENGAGERLIFERRSTGPRGDRLEGRNVVAPGAGPPMHVHHQQEEGFTVQQGRLGYQMLGQPERFAGPGESVAFEPGQGHRFWNAGDGDLLLTAYVDPADNAEYLLTEMFASQRWNGGARPNLFDIAFLMTRYRSEFTMLAIPRAVQAALFPLLYVIGKLLGKHRRFADAPDPVRRSPRAA